MLRRIEGVYHGNWDRGIGSPRSSWTLLLSNQSCCKEEPGFWSERLRRSAYVNNQTIPQSEAMSKVTVCDIKI